MGVGHSIFYQNKKVTFVRCGRKWGKALTLDETVITPNGFVAMSDVKVGMEIFNEHGVLTTITDVWDVVTDRDIYEVEFSNGAVIKACEDHKWLTTTKKGRRKDRKGDYYGKPEVVTTKEIAASVVSDRNGEYNHQIEKTKPLQFPAKELLIDPYLFGLWLGDGSSHGAKITTSDPEIRKAFDNVYGTSDYGSHDYGILNNFVTRLRELGVLKNKHIPHDYLFSSIEQRLALLQGLMDSDGTVHANRYTAEFCNTNKDLIDGVVWLTSSLGMKAYVKHKIPKLYDKECAECWIVSFRPEMPVFKLERKLNLIKRGKIKQNNHTIVSCKKIGKLPARCITVSSPTSLYLTSRHCIPTHNSEMAIYVLYRWAGTIPNGQFYFIAPYYNQAAELIWHPGRIKTFLGIHRDKYIESIQESDRRIIFKNGSFIKLLGSDNFEAGRGLNPDGAVYDEFKDHDYRFHQGFEDNLMAKDAPLLIVGTPPETFDHFFVRTEEAVKQDKLGSYFKMPTWRNPHIKPETIQRSKDAAIAKGEWAKYMREIEAEIVPGGANSIFPMLEIPRYDEKGNLAGESRHVKDGKKLRQQVGQYYKDYDYYWMNDPGSATCFAALFVAIHRGTKQIIILDEIYETDKKKTSTKQIAPIAFDKMNRIVPMQLFFKGYDHAAAWFANEMSNEYGIGLIPCIKARGQAEKEDQLSVIKDFMLADLYLVSNECKNHITEMAAYSTDENGKIPKKNDHSIDALRYIFQAANLHTVPKNRHTKDEDSRIIVDDDYYEYEDDFPIDIYDHEKEFYDE